MLVNKGVIQTSWAIIKLPIQKYVSRILNDKGWRTNLQIMIIWNDKKFHNLLLRLNLLLLLFIHVQLFATSWPTAYQASLPFTISWSLLQLISIKSVMPSNYLILCHPLLLLPSVFPRIRIFSNESALLIRWPQYWGFSFSISPSNEQSGLIGSIFIYYWHLEEYM